MNYKALGYSSLNNFLEDFKNSLLKTTHTYDFFVDWEKVEMNAKEHIIELGLLDSLTLTKSYDERKELLGKLLKEHPKILKVIPTLLAIREKNIEIAELTEQIMYKEFKFDKQYITNAQVDEILEFCEKVGIIDLFGKIKNAYSYVFGVEVGLDSNARKNRAGEIFRKFIELLLSISIKKLNCSYLPISYKREIRLGELEIEYPHKKADFLIFLKGKPFIVCEANIYHVPGSKPNEIVRSYIRLHNLLKQRDLFFFWFTDGPAWHEMWNSFKEGAENIDYIMNYEIARKKLNELLMRLIENKSEHLFKK
ncbi:MAG: DpnII family type II restriction endonuclease [Thermoproteota archaeon]